MSIRLAVRANAPKVFPVQADRACTELVALDRTISSPVTSLRWRALTRIVWEVGFDVIACSLMTSVATPGIVTVWLGWPVTVTATFTEVRCNVISIWLVVMPMRSARRSRGSKSSSTSAGNTSAKAAP